MERQFTTSREYAEFLASLPETEDNSRSTVADPLGEYLKWSARLANEQIVSHAPLPRKRVRCYECGYVIRDEAYEQNHEGTKHLNACPTRL